MVDDRSERMMLLELDPRLEPEVKAEMYDVQRRAIDAQERLAYLETLVELTREEE